MNDPMKIKETKIMLAEVPFQSFQGEGRFQNKNVLFIRFSNCNLNCDICDTKESWKNRIPYTMDQIKDIINDYYDKINGIVFTGGEPLLNQDILADIMFQFSDLDYEIETNGAIEIDFHKFIMFKNQLIFNISPKFNIKQLQGTQYKLRIFTNEFRKKKFNYIFKFLFKDMKDLEFTNWFVKENFVNSNKIYMQPIGTDSQILLDIVKNNSNYILENGWNLSLRTHIFLKVK